MQGGVRKRGNKWYYYFDLGMVDGKRKKIEHTAEGAQTKAEAESVLRRKILEYENAGTVFKPFEMTLHDFLMFWQLRLMNEKINEDHPFYLPFHIGFHNGDIKESKKETNRKSIKVWRILSSRF